MINEFTPRVRIVKIIMDLLDNQSGYTRKELAARYGLSVDSIKDDLNAIETAGFILEKDERHRYSFKLTKPYQQLKNLLHFSEDDQILLEKAIDQIAAHTKSGNRLKRKLNSLYDYHKLGHAYLRKPYLTRLNLLEQGQKDKKVVILKGYRSSNSNTILDRYVEPFHLDPSLDSLHALDTKIKKLRHFKISRIARVEMTDINWQYQGHHHIKLTDPFRINDDNQVPVHLRFKLGAYNELIEQFPIAENHIVIDNEEGVYDFQCKVNHQFIGLTNFILGFHHQLVEIIEPESLREHLHQQLKEIQKKLE
jgi:predicted DNA-binding transcriptional regulator YafY